MLIVSGDFHGLLSGDVAELCYHLELPQCFLH